MIIIAMCLELRLNHEKKNELKKCLVFKHSPTSVVEYKEVSANTFKWILTLGVKSPMNVSNFELDNILNK